MEEVGVAFREGRRGFRHKVNYRFRMKDCSGRNFLPLSWKTLFLESKGVSSCQLGTWVEIKKDFPKKQWEFSDS